MGPEREAGGCAITLRDGRACPEPVDPGAPLALCPNHLLAAYDWVAREVGVTDLLPSPCLACGRRVGIRYPSGWICAACEWRVGDLPDQGVIDVRVDVVYYLRFADRIKIGTSNNPRQRFAALPHHEVLAFEPGGRMLEQRRHAQFAELRIPRTEWFETGPALSEHVAALQAGVDDPWAQYASWRSRRIALGG
ncbi:GIY-YIG nuclease family protein [Diaminobutyricibacter sp. McL0608]|uniref:GIY-YIG nuclease family protein n=1 Tax=Leifsonia sp. McL0608 TaxID=3143537 RepID=UPI0031F2D6FA